MLEVLHIENIAIIEEADIRFEPGFNALTGETGAGKSIVIDALSAVLGQRTSRELIRTGADKARDRQRRKEHLPGKRPSRDGGTAEGAGQPPAEHPRPA